jgi:hypothetical protein
MKKNIAIGSALIFTVLIAMILFLTETKSVSQNDQTVNKNATEDIGQEIKYRTVKLYYYDFSKSECKGYSYLDAESTKEEEMGVSKGLVPVERKIVDSNNIIEDTIKLFLEGKVTDEEKTNGIYNNNYVGKYPLTGLKLIKISLSAEGILSLTFDDPEQNTKGTFCDVEIKRQQLEATAKQFPEVKSVEFLSSDGAFTVNDF